MEFPARSVLFERLMEFHTRVYARKDDWGVFEICWELRHCFCVRSMYKFFFIEFKEVLTIKYLQSIQSNAWSCTKYSF